MAEQLGMTCPWCHRWASDPDWGDDQAGDVGCEDCGTHPAYRCPHCDDLVDAVAARMNEPQPYPGDGKAGGGMAEIHPGIMHAWLAPKTRCPGCRTAIAPGEAFVRERDSYTYWHAACYRATAQHHAS